MKTRPACKFFTSGSCAAGDLCPFEHSLPSLGESASMSFAEFPEPSIAAPVSTAEISDKLEEEPVKPKLSYSQLAGLSAVKKSPVTTTIIDSDLNLYVNPPTQSLSSSKANMELCVFAVTGKCRFGSVCRNVHGLQCPRCLLYCLHPTDLEQNEDHIRECLEKPVKASNLEDEELECGICLERVLSKPDPRFGLLNCEHAFCLSCIRQWRASCQQGTNDPTQVRSCPLCRVVTYFIVPCSQFIRDGDEKAKVIEQYKRKVQSIPCRHYDYGRGRCPFGSSCFYSHLLLDGTAGPVDQPRSYVDANEQVKVVREFRLSDFLPIPQNNS